MHSRSAAQQINHWARIGRELEASGKVSQRDIEAVLAGDGSYDVTIQVLLL
ncbi:MAG: TA system antitoxin ParD family protein [Ornithinimicrobium sp.]|uniref:TA system antitoxin ParD family protein n=1 Tax=Ornithinimicrobium sp. TaxID=1977084 RepID=UPI003D9B7889